MKRRHAHRPLRCIEAKLQSLQHLCGNVGVDSALITWLLFLGPSVFFFLGCHFILQTIKQRQKLLHFPSNTSVDGKRVIKNFVDSGALHHLVKSPSACSRASRLVAAVVVVPVEPAQMKIV